jgi:hypothetical protein
MQYPDPTLHVLDEIGPTLEDAIEELLPARTLGGLVKPDVRNARYQVFRSVLA